MIDAMRLSRRHILGGAVASAAGALIDPHATLAEAPAPRLIDVHHHVFAPALTDAWQNWGAERKVRVPPVARDWTIEHTLAEMDKNGIATAVLSLSSNAGVWFGSDPAGMRRYARIHNEYATRLAQDHPGRLGVFATLPLPDVDGALAEIAYALDTLKADGIGLFTNYGKQWPGDREFAPVFEELDRRKAVVYFHPQTPDCCGNLIPGIGDNYVEFPHDTARAVMSLLFSGTFARRQNIRFIFSHAGGTVPMMAYRVLNLAKDRKDLGEIAPNGILHELQRLNYELAQAAFPPNVAALLKLVPISQALYGSDYPYVDVATSAQGIHKVGLTAAQLRAVARGNAEKLLPRLKA